MKISIQSVQLWASLSKLSTSKGKQYVSSSCQELTSSSYKLNIWDVGGQKTIRSYWRNYFEKTDALIWVVDATDRARMRDCKDELKGLLLEEVWCPCRWQRRAEGVLTLSIATVRSQPVDFLEQD